MPAGPLPRPSLNGRPSSSGPPSGRSSPARGARPDGGHANGGPPARPPTVGAATSLPRSAGAASDIGALRREADTLARERSERPTTTHILAALASREGLPALLLADRRVSRESLLKAARVAGDEDKDAIERVLARARELAGRAPRVTMSGCDADGTHVLLAMCVEVKCAAHHTLVKVGVDVNRLRAALLQQLTGLVEPRRQVAARDAETDAEGGRRSSIRVVAPPRTTALRPLPTPAAIPHARTSAPAPAPSPLRAPPSPTISSGEPVATGRMQPTPHDPAPQGADLSAPPSPVPPRGRAHRVGTRSAKHARRLDRDAVEPTRFDLDPKLAPTLCALGINLTAAAARGELDPVVGRDADIDRALDVLAKRSANNPCLVGVPGVGKTAIAHGVARRIADGIGVDGLDDRIVVEVPIGELLAGTGVRGALAERVGAIRREVLAAGGRVVLFLDEIHALVGGEIGDEVATELKTALARGELPCIGATTPAEYRRTIDRDPALARRFSVVEIGELDPVSARSVVDVGCRVLATHHGVSYDAGACEGSIAWTVRYLPSRALPDKALAALDLAGARARRNGAKKVDREALAAVVAEMAQVPVERLLERDGDRFLDLEARLSARVVGHHEALSRIARALRRGAAGLRGARPLLSALLLGPTGVGKTETAKAIADVLFRDPSAFTRIDLSEYSEAHAVARLLGAPPGYVGHEDGGQLTEAVRRRPYQVVLFDEMEKAHRDVLESLLQLLDEGRMTDGRGRTIDFTNTVVVLTSNLGSEVSVTPTTRRVGFGDPAEPVTTLRDRHSEQIVASARASLPPELFNRFDEVLVFSPLTREDVASIARIALDRLAAELRSARGLSLQVDAEAIELLLDKGGYDPAMGGRPVRRLIAQLVEAPLAELLLRGSASPGDVVWITVEEDRVVVDLVK